MARVTGLPSLASLAVKKKKLEPILNLPPGLDLRTIRSHENIPDKYIKANYVLEEHREQRVKLIQGFPLFRTIVEQLLGRNLDRGHVSDDDDDFDDDERNENRGYIEGQSIKLENLVNVLKNILSSEATLSLFKSAKIHYYGTECYTFVPGIGNIVPTEIVLCKEEVSYESDAVVITKLKKKVFAEINRYRRAKKTS